MSTGPSRLWIPTLANKYKLEPGLPTSHLDECLPVLVDAAPAEMPVLEPVLGGHRFAGSAPGPEPPVLLKKRGRNGKGLSVKHGQVEESNVGVSVLDDYVRDFLPALENVAGELEEIASPPDAFVDDDGAAAGAVFVQRVLQSLHLGLAAIDQDSLHLVDFVICKEVLVSLPFLTSSSAPLFICVAWGLNHSPELNNSLAGQGNTQNHIIAFFAHRAPVIRRACLTKRQAIVLFAEFAHLSWLSNGRLSLFALAMRQGIAHAAYLRANQAELLQFLQEFRLNPWVHFVVMAGKLLPQREAEAHQKMGGEEDSSGLHAQILLSSIQLGVALGFHNVATVIVDGQDIMDRLVRSFQLGRTAYLAIVLKFSALAGGQPRTVEHSHILGELNIELVEILPSHSLHPGQVKPVPACFCEILALLLRRHVDQFRNQNFLASHLDVRQPCLIVVDLDLQPTIISQQVPHVFLQ